MAALSANTRLRDRLLLGNLCPSGVELDIPVGASEEIYQGSAVSGDSGDLYAAPLAGGEIFYGFSLERVTGGSSNGDNTVKVVSGGIFSLSVTSAAVANIGAMAYATNDNTFGLADTSASNLGRILNVPASGTAIVQCLDTGEAGAQAGTATT